MFLRNAYSETLLLTIQNKTFQHRTFHPPNKTVNNKKSRKCKKTSYQKFFYYIQAKCGDITNKNPNAADDDEQTFIYRWP